MLHENLNAVRHHTSSLIRTNHQKILKNLQNGFFKGIFSSVPTDGSQMKLMTRKFGQWWNSNIYPKFLESCPYPAHGNFLSFLGRTRQGCFEIADSRLCTGEFRKPTTEEKLDRFS